MVPFLAATFLAALAAPALPDPAALATPAAPAGGGREGTKPARDDVPRPTLQELLLRLKKERDDHQGQLAGADTAGRLERVADQRAAANLMENLGGTGFHPGTGPCS